MSEMERIDRAADYVRDVLGTAEIAIVLGSGLGALAERIEGAEALPYSDIPGFPVSTAPEHKGRFVFGTIGDKEVVLMDGRVHLYEGYTPQQVVMPIRLMRQMGIHTVLLTNASGGIRRDLHAGDLAVERVHEVGVLDRRDVISSLVPSPLRGENDPSLGVRFPDMRHVYDEDLQRLFRQTAKALDIPLKSGVYIQLQGPAFETPAEIKMCAALGADAVGMSTAIEAQAARHCGLRVAGVSCITNLASGLLDCPLTSEEVGETAAKVAENFQSLILETVKRM